jgi:hypothetical protein
VNKCQNCGIGIGGRYHIDKGEVIQRIEQTEYHFKSMVICGSCKGVVETRGYLIPFSDGYTDIIFKDGSKYRIGEYRWVQLNKGCGWEKLKQKIRNIVRSRVEV